jgi:hypothetical protein
MAHKNLCLKRIDGTCSVSRDVSVKHIGAYRICKGDGHVYSSDFPYHKECADFSVEKQPAQLELAL